MLFWLIFSQSRDRKMEFLFIPDILLMDCFMKSYDRPYTAFFSVLHNWRHVLRKEGVKEKNEIMVLQWDICTFLNAIRKPKACSFYQCKVFLKPIRIEISTIRYTVEDFSGNISHVSFNQPDFVPNSICKLYGSVHSLFYKKLVIGSR